MELHFRLWFPILSQEKGWRSAIDETDTKGYGMVDNMRAQIHVLVSEFMSDCIRNRETSIFINVTASFF